MGKKVPREAARLKSIAQDDGYILGAHALPAAAASPAASAAAASRSAAVPQSGLPLSPGPLSSSFHPKSPATGRALI